MARFNEILVGRYNRAVQKLFSMKGAASLVTLADEAMPVFPFFWGAEMRYLEGWERFGAVSSLVAAVAAQNTAVRLRNPAGSNVIAVIERIFGIPGAADTLLLANTLASDTDLAQAVGQSRLDNRGRAKAVLIASAGNNSVGGLSIGAVGVGANLHADFIITDIQEIPLLPNDQLEVRTVGLNETLRAGFVWRERFLEESERQ